MIKDLPNVLPWVNGVSFLPLIVESDCTNLVNLISHESWDLSELSNLVEEIVSMSEAALVVFFSWCPRSANGAAHRLACAKVSFGSFEISFVKLSSSCSS